MGTSSTFITEHRYCYYDIFVLYITMPHHCAFPNTQENPRTNWKAWLSWMSFFDWSIINSHTLVSFVDRYACMIQNNAQVIIKGYISGTPLFSSVKFTFKCLIWHYPSVKLFFLFFKKNLALVLKKLDISPHTHSGW